LAQAIPSLHLQPCSFRRDLVAFLGNGGVRSLVLRFAMHVSALHAVEVDQANPIRKMVNFLRGLAKQVAKEGDKEKEPYEKYKWRLDGDDAVSVGSESHFQAGLALIRFYLAD